MLQTVPPQAEAGTPVVLPATEAGAGTPEERLSDADPLGLLRDMLGNPAVHDLVRQLRWTAGMMRGPVTGPEFNRRAGYVLEAVALLVSAQAVLAVVPEQPVVPLDPAVIPAAEQV